MSATLLIAAIPQGFGIVCFLKSMLRASSGCPDAQGEFLKFADVPLALSLETLPFRSPQLSKYSFDAEGPFPRGIFLRLGFPSGNRKALT